MTQHPLASEVSFNEAIIRVAAAHERVVSFRYAKGDGRHIERRYLLPSEIHQVKGHLTVTGYDPDRDEPRAYRLDRVTGEVAF